MTFTTLSFAAFLAIVFSAYWSLGRRGWQNILIVAASYVFYAWWDYRFCGLMLLTCLTDFTVGALLGKTSSPTRRKILLVISLTVDLGVLLEDVFLASQADMVLAYDPEPKVSIDFNHTPHSSIFAPDQTKVVGGRTVRVLAWYDNEWGFSCRMADVAGAMGRLLH